MFCTHISQMLIAIELKLHERAAEIAVHDSGYCEDDPIMKSRSVFADVLQASMSLTSIL